MGRYKGISTSVPSADSATAYKRKHRICVNFLKKKYLHDPCIKRCRHMILGHVLKKEHFKIDYLNPSNGYTVYDFHLLG